ncbi:Aste57867_18998 [Aphanomyces stellatus]|uniref:Aste57867_18998 protein n=1 Tax=Aphanomyces stellatus TaxID=120398 RepID=A0A485LBT6_9STRA|nr:hypothetical protein As57867_018934 [Aphanomyces stellatus]VFT95724.1 Aste57867_18998 [Aphanomyces stellatus]
MRRRSSSASLLAGFAQLDCSITHRVKRAHTAEDAGRISNLIQYPYKNPVPRLNTRHRMSDDSHDRGGDARDGMDGRLTPPSTIYSIGSNFSDEIDTQGVMVSFRDGSQILVPPSSAPSSIQSSDGRDSVIVIKVQWFSQKLGLLLENVKNRSIVKDLLPEMDLASNPDLAQLQRGDELVSIVDESTILLGFDATVRRLGTVAKPAMLHFRRFTRPDQPSSSPIRPSNASTLRSSQSSSAVSVPPAPKGHQDTRVLMFEDSFVESLVSTFLAPIQSMPPTDSELSWGVPSGSSMPIMSLHGPSSLDSADDDMTDHRPWGIPSSSPLVASDFDVDDARAGQGRSEIFPLSTDTHKVCTMIKWAGEPLGIALQKADSGDLEVKFCTGDGLAASFDCLAPGDILVSVANVPMKAFGLATCLDFLHAAQKPVPMLFWRRVESVVPPPAPKTLGPEAWTVQWRGIDPWGLSLKHFYCHKHLVLVVSALASDGAFGKLSVGDRLVAINDVPVDELGLDTTMQVLMHQAADSTASAKAAPPLYLTFHLQDRPWMV